MCKMANIWLSCLMILTGFCLGINTEQRARPIGYYNVVSAEEFQKEISSKSELFIRVAYFATGETQGHIATAFRKNYREAGEYLQRFKVPLITVDCKKDPVKEYCDKPKVDSMVFVFRENYVMDEMPLDILYNVDSIVANILHLALITEVPTVQTALELSAVKQRVKGKKDVILGKLLAIGTAADRAFMEGAFAAQFAFGNKFQFVATTNQEDNLLGTSDKYEWDELENRVWYFDCINADKMDDCNRVIFHGPMTVPNIALFLKTLNMPLVYEESNLKDIFKKQLHEFFGIPVAYLVTTADEYQNHKQTLLVVAKKYKGNLAFAINTTEPGVALADVCPQAPPCISIKPPGEKFSMRLSKPFNFVNVDQLVKAFLDDHFFDPAAEEDEDFYEELVPDQERQDDSVAMAVHEMKPLKLNLTDIPPLTDKTIQEFLDANSVAIITFTVKWDSRSLAFLQPYHDAAKILIKDLSLDHSPLGRVECSNWPDVCEMNNVTAYPTIKIYKNSRFVGNYKGILNTTGILKAFHLHSTPNPMKLSDSMEVELFKQGKLPKWAAGLLQAVTVAVIPNRIEDENVVAKVGENLHGEHLLGICTGKCAKDVKINTNSYLVVSKWNDPHQPEINFQGQMRSSKIIEFIEKASLPIVPELTPASLPKYFSKGLPFLILFRVPGEDSDRIEKVLAQLAKFEDRVVMSWMDASPHSVGSHLLHNYKLKDVTPPNLVFLDHSTSRVCNYPDIELIKSEKDLLASVTQWAPDMLRQEGNCNALESGHYEPQVPSYDFLARIKEDRLNQRDHGRGRFGTNMEDNVRIEMTKSNGDGEKKIVAEIEEEMFALNEAEEEGERVDIKQHGHIEL